MPAATGMKADYLLKSLLSCLADRVWATGNFLRQPVNVIARSRAKDNDPTRVGAAVGSVGTSQMSSEVQAALFPS